MTDDAAKVPTPLQNRAAASAKLRMAQTVLDSRKEDALKFLVPKRLKKELQALADADRRELGPYIQIVLEAHVEAKKRGGKR